MIVEFVGVPGAGKTTSMVLVRQQLEEAGIAVRYHLIGSGEPSGFDARSRVRRNYARVTRLASAPRLAAAASLRVRNKATGADLLRVVNRELARRTVRDISGGVVLIDEGPLHKICLLHADGRIWRPTNLARWVVAPDLCVVLETGHGTALARIRARAHSSRVDGKPIAELETYLARYADGLRLVEQRLRCPVVHVSSTPADALHEMHAEIMRWLPHTSHVGDQRPSDGGP